MTPALLQAMRDLVPAPPPDEPPVWRMLQPECEPRPTTAATQDADPTA